MHLSSVCVAQSTKIIATTSTILFRRFTVAFSSAGRAHYHSSSSSQQPSHRLTQPSSISYQSLFYSLDTIKKKQGIESLLRRNLSSTTQQQQQHEDEDAGTTSTSTSSSPSNTNIDTKHPTKSSSLSKFSVPAMDTDTTSNDVSYTGYERWVRRLYATNMFHPVKLGLDNMRLLHKLIGNPMDDVSYTYIILCIIFLNFAYDITIHHTSSHRHPFLNTYQSSLISAESSCCSRCWN
jgi:hypothetical protein